jgi:hypothetical protein
LGTPSRNRGRSHPMGLWPALRRSKRRTSGQRTSTDPLPTLRALSGLGWQLRCPSHGTCVFWHYPSSARRAMVDSRAYDGENHGGSDVDRTDDRNAMRVPRRGYRRLPAEQCVPQTHNSACTPVGIPSSATVIDPLGSALVSVWVYQITQHNARIVRGAEREARRTSFSERAFTDDVR